MLLTSDDAKKINRLIRAAQGYFDKAEWLTDEAVELRNALRAIDFLVGESAGNSAIHSDAVALASGVSADCPTRDAELPANGAGEVHASGAPSPDEWWETAKAISLGFMPGREEK